MSGSEAVAWLQTVDADAVTVETVQAVLTAAVRLYAAKAESAGSFPAVSPGSGVTASEAGLVASRLLRAADVDLFELMIWQGMRDG